MLKKIKSYIQSRSLIFLSGITTGLLSYIALQNRGSSESLTLIQTIIAIVALVPIVLSLPELNTSLKKFTAKPNFKITLRGNSINRSMSEAISDEDLWRQEENEIKFDYSEVQLFPLGSDISRMRLVIRNLGTGTLHAPVIRLVPIEPDNRSVLTPDKGTGFTRELEGYVLYNPIGHIMSNDTVVYGIMYSSHLGDRNGTFKYKLTIRGADQDEVWTFPFTITVECTQVDR